MADIQVGDCIKYKGNLYIVDELGESSSGKKGIFVYTRNSHYREFIYLEHVEFVARCD